MGSFEEDILPLLKEPDHEVTDLELAQMYYGGYLWVVYGTLNPEHYYEYEREQWGLPQGHATTILEDNPISRMYLRKLLSQNLENALKAVANRNGIPISADISPNELVTLYQDSYLLDKSKHFDDLAHMDDRMRRLANPFLTGDNMHRLWRRVVGDKQVSTLPLLEELIIFM